MLDQTGVADVPHESWEPSRTPEHQLHPPTWLNIDLVEADLRRDDTAGDARRYFLNQYDRCVQAAS